VARSDGTVTATRLERERRDDVELRGPVDMIDADDRMFTILGVAIPTGGTTVFRDGRDRPLSESELYDRITSGSVVEARDRQDGDETDFDFADEGELEEPDLEDGDDDSVDDSGDDFDDSDDRS
jgi:hypothetical protein